MESRFEVACNISYGNARLFMPEAASQAAPGFPLLTTPLYYEASAPYLSKDARKGWAQANSPPEWSALLLSSPDCACR